MSSSVVYVLSGKHAKLQLRGSKLRVCTVTFLTWLPGGQFNQSANELLSIVCYGALCPLAMVWTNAKRLGKTYGGLWSVASICCFGLSVWYLRGSENLIYNLYLKLRISVILRLNITVFCNFK